MVVVRLVEEIVIKIVIPVCTLLCIFRDAMLSVSLAVLILFISVCVAGVLWSRANRASSGSPLWTLGLTRWPSCFTRNA